MMNNVFANNLANLDNNVKIVPPPQPVAPQSLPASILPSSPGNSNTVAAANVTAPVPTTQSIPTTSPVVMPGQPITNGTLVVNTAQPVTTTATVVTPKSISSINATTTPSVTTTTVKPGVNSTSIVTTMNPHLSSNATNSTKPLVIASKKPITIKAKNGTKVVIKMAVNQTKLDKNGKPILKHPYLKKMVVVGPNGKKYVKIIDEDTERHKKLIMRIKALEKSLDKANKRMAMLKDENFNEIIQDQLGAILNKVQYKGGVVIKVKRPPPKDPNDFIGEAAHKTESKKIKRKRINQIIINGNTRTVRKVSNLDTIISNTSKLNKNRFTFNSTNSMLTLTTKIDIKKASEKSSNQNPANTSRKKIVVKTTVKNNHKEQTNISAKKINNKIPIKSDKSKFKDFRLNSTSTLKYPVVKFERHTGRPIKRVFRKKVKEDAKNKRLEQSRIHKEKSIASLKLKI